MKIAINQKPICSPWGGGNQFLNAMDQFIQSTGNEVVYNLNDSDIDIILLIDPRRRNPSNLFLPKDIIKYKAMTNPNVVVVHRINENDERKGTKTLNMRLKLANLCADHTIFIASWLKQLSVWQNKTTQNSSVVLNGADQLIFNRTDKQNWNGKERLKLVTHHWGGNHLKGFDIYKKLDNMLVSEQWRDIIEFTYVGNVPKGFTFNHAHHLKPLSGCALATELKKHHVYVTGSQFEPGGMHHIEGAMCGLPVLYRNSGALPEYCHDYGVMFEGLHDFEQQLKSIMNQYHHYLHALDNYQHTSENMCKHYLQCFEDLLSQKSSKLHHKNHKIKQLLVFSMMQFIW